MATTVEMIRNGSAPTELSMARNRVLVVCVPVCADVAGEVGHVPDRLADGDLKPHPPFAGTRRSEDAKFLEHSHCAG